MTFSEFQMYARAFANDPKAWAAFIASCNEQGISLPTDDDEPGSRATDPKPARFDATPSPPVQARSHRSAEGRANLASTDERRVGPVRGPDGVLRIHAGCPGIYRAQLAARRGR